MKDIKKIYYDQNMAIEKHRDEFILYSSLNHDMINVNEHSYMLIKTIIDSGGLIETNKITETFKNKYSIILSVSDIQEQIKKLTSTNLFFTSNKDFIEMQQKIKTSYEIPFDQNLKMAYLHPTLRCNFNCSYCYNREFIKKNDIKELSTNEWINIIEKLKDKKVKHFIFTGGEVLLREDLEDILKNTKGKQTFVQLLTNGSLLKDRYKTIVPNIDLIILSLDSLDKNINAATRSACGFENILQVIELFSKEYPEKIMIRSVITHHNVNKIKDFSKTIYERYGIKSSNVIFIPNNSEEIKLVPKINFQDTLAIDTKNMNLNILPKTFRCGATSSIIAVDPQGDIYPCQSLLLKEMKICSILEPDWHEQLLHSKIRDMFRKLNISNIEKCKDCKYKYFCGGGCPAIAYKLYGSFDSHLEYLCDYQKDAAIFRLKNNCSEWNEL